MSASKIPLHGRNHLPGGSDPLRVYQGFATSARLPLFTDGIVNDDNDDWNTTTIDDRLRGNACLESGGSDGAYVTRKVALGPRGSTWTLFVAYAGAPDAGKFNVDIATVPSPNPARAGDNDLETLAPDSGGTAWNWVGLAVGVDTYAASFEDSAAYPAIGFRIMGPDSADLTAFTALGDPFPPVATIDGGSGVYGVRFTVDGKNASSSGYVVRLTEVRFDRQDDSGFV